MSVAGDKSKVQSGGTWETIKIVSQALILALLVRTFLYQPFNIPSGSMEDTLQVGDYIFVSKFAYGYSHYSLPFSPNIFGGRIWAGEGPQRGDIAVFRLPRDDKIDYIKRVIGMPGDRIRVADGQVFINDEPVQREKLPDAVGSFGRPVTRWRETLSNGVSYETLDLTPRGALDNTGEYVVPAGHYFMMGDNRDNSIDSRVPPEQQGVGYVPLENFVGRAEIIFFSVGDGASGWEFWKWPWTVRLDRLFKAP